MTQLAIAENMNEQWTSRGRPPKEDRGTRHTVGGLWPTGDSVQDWMLRTEVLTLTHTTCSKMQY